MVKFSKFRSESFHRDTDRRCFVYISWNLANGKSVKSCVINLTKKQQNFACLLNCPKSAKASPKICTQSAPDFMQIGSLSAALQLNA